MTTLREAAQQALEALDRSDYFGWQSNIPIIKSLREALAQREPEPVAWTTMPDANDWTFVSGSANPNGKLNGKWYPLYTSPPQRKPLTVEQLRDIREHQRLLEELGPVWAPMLYYFCQAIERAHGIGGEE